jgi:hypothetical protein
VVVAKARILKIAKKSTSKCPLNLRIEIENPNIKRANQCQIIYVCVYSKYRLDDFKRGFVA